MRKVAFAILVAAIVSACSSGELHKIGTLRQKSISEVSNNLAIGCETLDRDYADYHAYKEYLAPLGMRYLRLQAGWAKTEQKRGVYDFAWLDSIIDDAVARGLGPWLELSYGNPIYPGGGTKFLQGGWPRSQVAIRAWSRWVRATVERYKGKVHQWEIWNEPDNTVRREGANPAEIVDLTILTCRIIKEIEPSAKIAVFGLASGRRVAEVEMLVGTLAEKLKAANEEHLVDWVTYHGYRYEPEQSYFTDGDSLLKVIRRHDFDVDIWQGESGAPSVANMGGALGDYGWTEQTQAKWALRKMMNDHGNGVRTSIFSIADMNYSANDEIKKKNHKGILETDNQNRVVRPKWAYSAVRNFVSVFDNLDKVCDKSSVKISASANDSLSSPLLYLFEDNATSLHSLVLWQGGATPVDGEWSRCVEVEIPQFACDHPVCVDLLSGAIYEIPYRKIGKNFTFKAVPFYDSPVVICDRTIIEME